MNWRDIPPLTRSGSYAVDVPWGTLLRHVDKDAAEVGLNLMPDFQRGHVWTEAQQVAYVEYALREGAITGKDLYFNHPGWMRNWKGEYVIVDGLQRLTAALKFLRNEMRAYGHLFKEFEGHARVIQASFRWHVNNLQTRREVLQWYLEFNSGGTPHTDAELDRVRGLLKEAEKK